MLSQVEGANGMGVLRNKMKVGGVPILYHGALAAAAATFVGHYPWFFTFNTLNESLPQVLYRHPLLSLLHSDSTTSVSIAHGTIDEKTAAA